jgi:hypothetical protein
MPYDGGWRWIFHPAIPKKKTHPQLVAEGGWRSIIWWEIRMGFRVFGTEFRLPDYG